MTAATTLALLALVGGVPTGYVIDNAGLLNPMTVQELDAVLYQHEVETSNQVVVETIMSLGGELLEDYSLRRAMALRIGQKGHDNGVFVLISRDDRKMRIEVGHGLEGALPDVICARIIREEMMPRFREGSYDDGVTAGVNKILAAIRGEYTAGPLDRLRAVVPVDRLPEAPHAVQIVVGTFYWIFSVAWAFAGPVLFHIRKHPFRLGLLPGIALSALLVWAYPFTLVPLGFMALMAVVNKFAPNAGRTYSGSGSSGGWSSSGSGSSWSSSSSGSSSGSSFSGGGGSFGGGGASGSW